MSRLSNFLKDKIERKIFFEIERFPRIFGSNYFKKAPLQIQIIGTNGKGSTGRFLACGLQSFGKNIFHFTSPHIHKLNERFWLNGKNISDEELEETHELVFAKLTTSEKQEISYFEYCALLAAQIAQSCDIAIFEAGMGGEFDATTSFEIDITIATSIDFDHMEILGETIEQIALTKLKAAKKILLIGKQNFKNELEQTLNLLNPKLQIYNYKAWIRDDDKLIAKQICESLNIAICPFVNNLLLAIGAIRMLGYEPNKECFDDFDLQARTQQIDDYVWLDAGHNPSAAKAIAINFTKKSIRLIFGCTKDKDGLAMLQEFTHIARHVEFLDYNSLRKTDKSKLIKYANMANIKVRRYDKNIKEKTLVFGSFELIDAFLKDYYG